MATIDSLRHKWDGITPRERGLVVLLGVCTPLIVLLWMALGIGDHLDSIEDDNAKMRKALDVLAVYRLNGGPQQAPVGPEANIGPEPVKLESYLNAAAQKVGISVPGYKSKTPTPRGNGFMMHTVELQVNGLTMEQATQFLEAIESDNRLVVVSEMTMKRSFSDRQKLDLKLDVSTFSKPAADAAAGSGSGTASASAAPVPPP